VQAYLAQRLPDLAATTEVVGLMHRRTERHPLSMVHVVDYLAQQGTLATLDPALGSKPFAAAAAEGPAALQPLIELQLGRLHRLIGAREEAGYGEQAYERAAELAMYFQRGRDYRRAVAYLLWAVENAAGRSAPCEVIGFVTQGLAVLTHLPHTPERDQQEVALQLLLGPALIVTHGWTSPAIERAYRRAHDLCQQLGETAQLFPVLFGLWLPALVGLEMQTARTLAEELLTLAQRLRDPVLRLEADWALGITVFYVGEFATVRDHMTYGIALYNSRQHQALRPSPSPTASRPKPGNYAPR
jgi:hypothetical protein